MTPPLSRRHQQQRPLSAVPAEVSLLAGMVGGAIGVGVAYPLDTVKVKTQAFAETAAPGEKLPSVWALARRVLDEEGPAAFYSGVSSTMLGQALIKGVVFWSYEATKTLVVDLLSAGGSVGVDAAALSAGWLFFAACVSGAVGSFVVTPVERVKCVMQASSGGAIESPEGEPEGEEGERRTFLAASPPVSSSQPSYSNGSSSSEQQQQQQVVRFSSPVGCVREIVRTDGWGGLMTRGLGPTLLREVPAYGFYFLAYESTKDALLALLQQQQNPAAAAATAAAWWVPMLGGAAAGVASWVPVYPVDVVKTNVQVSADGGRREGALDVAKRLYGSSGGVAVFWEGLGPKVARAIVNHATTFVVFEQLCQWYAATSGLTYVA